MSSESHELRPRKTPCATCPYRRDVPSGLWDESEYAKLQSYDGDTGQQAEAGAFAVFLCHQQDGCMCAGWIGTHDPEELLALRLAGGRVDWDAVREFETSVPLHESGSAAAAHGLKDYFDPGEKAREQIRKLTRAEALRKEQER
ncbi:hypothetical protein PBI_DEWDROP_17 [Microbacterium phage Dewdrop]|nr:hypothetical protein PBI_LEAF_17 [Microbacterium phage Leaf]QGZ17386.1 hypothetical protein PBI_DEWDROP_17 [Microbacterium phage Dewdrop]